MAGELARAIDAIPVVASTSERDLLYSTPSRDQRVHLRTTGEVQRFDGVSWIADIAGGIGGYYDVKAGTSPAIGDGVTDDRAHVASSDTAAQVLGQALLFRPGTYAIASNLTITSPVTLLPGAKLKPASGVTVTIAGAVDAPPAAIVDTSAGGNLAFTGNTHIDRYLPQWWGVVGDQTTDDQPALTKMIAAIPDYARVFFPARLHMKLGATLLLSDRQGIVFETGLSAQSAATSSHAPSFYWAGGAGGTMISLDKCRYCAVRGFLMVPNGTTNANICFDLDGYASGHIGSGCMVEDNFCQQTAVNASFVFCRISETVISNQEYHHIRRNVAELSAAPARVTSLAAITSGTAILTTSGSFFLASDAGKPIVVQGAGAGGGLLSTTVLSFTSATQVTLATNASTTVSAAQAQVDVNTGIGVKIGASSNAKRINIEENAFTQGQYGIYALNGSFRSQLNSFTMNECDIYCSASSEPCIDEQSNSEYSRQHVYWAASQPLAVRGGRLSIYWAKAGGAYMEIGAGAIDVLTEGVLFEGGLTTGGKLWGLANASNVRLVNIANRYIATITAVQSGYNDAPGTRSVVSLYEDGITGLSGQDWRRNGKIASSYRDSGDFSVVSGAADASAGTPVAVGIAGSAAPTTANISASGKGVAVQGAINQTSAFVFGSAYAFRALMPTHTAGSMTNAYGVYVETGAPTGTGDIADAYGLYLALQKGNAAVVRGWGIYQAGAADKNKLFGRTFQAAPNSAPTDGDLSAASFTPYLNEATNTLRARAVYTDGTTFKTLIVGGVQQAANADTAGATLAALETEVNELKAALRAFGILAP